MNMMLSQLMDSWTTCSFKLWQLLAEAKLSVLFGYPKIDGLPIPKGRLSKGPKIIQYGGTVPSTFQLLYISNVCANYHVTSGPPRSFHGNDVHEMIIA